MATPTFAEVWAQIADVVDIYDTIRTDGQTSVITKLDTYVQNLEGDGAATAAARARATRAAYAGILDRFRANLEPHLVDLATAIGTAARPGTSEFWRDLREYMVDNSQDLNSRDISFGSISAGGSNVGDGTIYRLTTDEYDQAIEAVFLDVVTARCVRDQNSGTLVGREVFELTHGDALPDRISEAGSGRRGTIVGHAGDEILRNASFQTLDGTVGSPTTIPNWTVANDIANFELDSTNYFRSSPEEKANGTSYSLKITATDTISQKLSTLNRSLDPNTPYMALCRYNRTVGSDSGTLVLRMGAETATVAVSAQSGWQTLALAMDGDKWLRQFQEDDLDLMVDWTRTGGDGLRVDDVLFGPMTRFDNLWYFAAGGATHFLTEDEFTFTDALNGSDGKIQAWLWRAYGVWLPSVTDTTETISDP